MKTFVTLKNNNKVLILVCAVFFLIFPTTAYGSSEEINLEIKSTVSEVGVGQDLVVSVFVQNPSARPINAIDTTLLIPKNYFEIKELWLGDSVVPLWLEDPEIKETESAWLVPLSGVIPGGTTIDDAEIVRVVLTSQSLLGAASIRLLSPKIFLHNRTADVLELQTIYAEINVATLEDAGLIQEITAIDKIPPEPFVPIVASDPALYEGDYFLMFQTIDRQSGVSHFELIESDIYYEEDVLIQDENLWWKRVENPYQLVDQSLSSYIYIKAVDRHGNARVVVIPPTNNLKKNTAYPIMKGVITLVALFGLLFVWKKKTQHVEKNEDE